MACLYLKNMEAPKERQKCDVYSRVVGFLTPVQQWNRGKQAEYFDRKTYDRTLESDSCCGE